MRDIQKSGAVGMRLLKNKFKELNALLGLKEGTREIKVSYGSVAKDKQEIAMLTNSLMQIMITLATQVDVPSPFKVIF